MKRDSNRSLDPWSMLKTPPAPPRPVRREREAGYPLGDFGKGVCKASYVAALGFDSRTKEKALMEEVGCEKKVEATGGK